MRGLAGYYSLVREIALSDFKLRHKNSTLGFVWVILEPLAMMSIMYVIFGRIVRIQVDHYPLFLLIGLVQWQLFARGTANGINAMAGRSDILKKIYFPRKVMVLSACLTTLVMTVFEIIIFLAMGMVLGLKFHIGLLWLLPMFLLQFILVYGISLLFAPLNLRFRDFQKLWAIITRMGFYLSPVIYPVAFISKSLSGFWLEIYLFNPMARIIHVSRRIVFPEGPYLDKHLFLLMVMVAAIFLAGNMVFNRMEPKFGDYL